MTTREFSNSFPQWQINISFMKFQERVRVDSSQRSDRIRKVSSSNQHWCFPFTRRATSMKTCKEFVFDLLKREKQMKITDGMSIDRIDRALSIFFNTFLYYMVFGRFFRESRENTLNYQRSKNHSCSLHFERTLTETRRKVQSLITITPSAFIWYKYQQRQIML